MRINNHNNFNYSSRDFGSEFYSKFSAEIYRYDKPITLRKALHQIYNGKVGFERCVSDQDIFKQFIEDFNNEKIGRRKVNKIIGAGSSSIAFETPAGDILKISKENPFVNDRPIQNFDAKIFKRGKHNKSYYLIEEKLENLNYKRGMNVTNPVLKVVDNIIKSGFKPIDLEGYQIWQIGINKDGIIKLRDHGCAVFKSRFQEIIYRLKKLINR